MKNVARMLGLGRALYYLWHAPAGAVRRSVTAGGPWPQWLDRAGSRRMERAARMLPTARGPVSPGITEVHFLTGRAFWYQTAFCLHTLQQQTGLVIRAHFHDDGTLQPDQGRQLLALFPAATLESRTESDERIAHLLPEARFPTLHAERHQPYPNFLKLTDVHAGRAGWRLVLDSDMLFFRRPQVLLDWLHCPTRPLHMRDVAEAYGYTPGLMGELAGAAVTPLVNVGFCGLNSSTFDWDRLEHWTRTLITREGTRYYVEQALSAMLSAAQDPLILPAKDYRVLPDAQECANPRAVMHHYVSQSKRHYFRRTWEIAARLASAAGQ